MKKYLLILLALLPLLGAAKEKKDNSDPKYLAGAITMNEEGKVCFTKEINVPSLSKAELYDTMLKWANSRFKQDGKLISRVVYTNEEAGDIAASAEEYIVFSSSALSLDRTRIYYQFFIKVQEGHCDLTMTRIRYWYDENRDGGQKYSAEEWITDEMALNKKKTKLAPICGKFRRKTIDLKDELFKSATDAVGEHTLATTPATVAPVQQATAVPGVTGELKDVKQEQLPANLNDIAAKGRITLTANDEEVDIKAENWGGFGKLFNKDVAYTLIDQSKIAVSAMAEHAETYMISFYMPGATQPSVVITCKKSMSKDMSADELKSLNQSADTSKAYKMYIGEITRIQMR